MRDLILKPVISEKSMTQAASGKYVFDVPTFANKIEIAKSVADMFKVGVVDVNVLIQKGKVKRTRNIRGKRVNTKKAIVTLKKGDSIAAFAVEEAK